MYPVIRVLVLFFAFSLLPLAVRAQARLHSLETPTGPRSYLYSVSPSTEPAPLLLFLHGEEQASRETMEMYFRQWQGVVSARGWHLVLPWTEGRFAFHSDEGMRAVRAVVEDFRRQHPVDARRVYLAGHGDGSPGVFTAISRLPDAWAAALAIGGDANRAIETNRLYAGNAAHTPLLWLYEENRAPVLKSAIRRMQFAGLKGRFEAASEFGAEQAVEWLRQHSSAALPTSVDFETGSLDFRRAHWLEVAEFDFTQRNDVLATTRVDPGTGAFLRLGGFGYDPEGKGPGVPVKWLPQNYKGPLKLEDCIVSIAGKMVQDADHYAEIMEAQRESRDVGIILRRNDKNMRIETRIVIPKRDESDTARVLAEYLADPGELLVVTRGVKSLILQVPDAWVPLKISWNGTDLESATISGCWLLDSQPPEAISPKHASGEAGPIARPIPCTGSFGASSVP